MEHRLDAAEEAIKQALIYKNEWPDVAQKYYLDSIDLINMHQRYHDQIIVLINGYKKEKGEPPAPMMAIYNYMHERLIEQFAKIKAWQEEFKK